MLAFLNAATSAEQLERDIEFPREPDIGVRLGQRLLDARAALGGSFTDIVAGRAVRLIGPERFTEILRRRARPRSGALGRAVLRRRALATPTETGLVLDARPAPAGRLAGRAAHAAPAGQ